MWLLITVIAPLGGFSSVLKSNYVDDDWCGSSVDSLPERWLQDSLKKRNPPGRSQPSIFSMKDLSSSSLRYIRSQLEKMKSMLRKSANWSIKMQYILYGSDFLHQTALTKRVKLFFLFFSKNLQHMNWRTPQTEHIYLKVWSLVSC